jgi:DNA-nicking Smr family endonuclease
LTVQALGGGSLELPALASARDGRPPSLSGDDEPVELPVEDVLDLHAFAPREVASVVAEYLDAAAAGGFDEVRLIHGRGKGVQRTLVRAVLAEHPRVAGFADAPPERGGWGATIVRLRRG